MPATIKDKDGYDERTLKPYKEFLSNFSSFFTLNYDPLLYWMSLHFINKGDKDITSIIEQEEKIKSTQEGSKDYEKAQTKMKEKFGKCMSTIREIIFSNVAKKDNYKMKVFYENECLFDEPLSKVEADKAVTLKKISHTICANMENSIANNEQLKEEYEKIEAHVLSNYNTKKAETIANKDGIKVNFTDGFLSNSQSKLLEWDSDNPQTAFFLHGAFHILEKDGKTIKIKADPTNTMLKNIKEERQKGFKSLTVLESEHKNKIDEINRYAYLKYCFDNFKNIQGNLVTFGVSFYDSDNHIIEFINNNRALKNIYIGCYDEPSTELIEKFKNNDKVKYFSTKSMF